MLEIHWHDDNNENVVGQAGPWDLAVDFDMPTLRLSQREFEDFLKRFNTDKETALEGGVLLAEAQDRQRGKVYIIDSSPAICASCGKIINGDSEACPHCGAEYLGRCWSGDCDCPYIVDYLHLRPSEEELDAMDDDQYFYYEDRSDCELVEEAAERGEILALHTGDVSYYSRR